MQTATIRTKDGTDRQVDGGQLETLSRELIGELILPEDDRYDEARAVWNGMIDRRPGMIVRCRGATDVIHAVNFVRENNLELSVRGGGHNVAGAAVRESAVSIDLSEMNQVSVDPEGERATVEAGATLGDVDAATQEHGLAVPLGVVSATGVAGLALHGGYGWLTRQYGLTADNMVSAEVVTANGDLLTADMENNPDLLWALRGGGGNFGIVTSFEFRAYPVGPEVWFAATMYPAEVGREGLRFYREFVQSAPKELGAIAFYWSAPDEEPIPKDFRGRPVFMFAGCYTGPVHDGEKAVRPLREFDKPVADLSGKMPYVEVQQFLDEDYPNGRNYYWKSTYLRGLEDELIDAIARYAAERPSPLTSIDVWSLGGAVQRYGSADSPLIHRRAPFLLAIESNWEDSSRNEENVEWTREAFQDLSRFSDGGTYLNFPGFAEEGEEMLRGAYGPNYKRLRRIKAKYDPDNLFHGHLNIAPA